MYLLVWYHITVTVSDRSILRGFYWTMRMKATVWIASHVSLQSEMLKKLQLLDTQQLCPNRCMVCGAFVLYVVLNLAPM